jgi:hypothetical protein
MWQIEMQTAELLVPELRADILTTELKSPVTDSILAETKHYILRFKNLYILLSIVKNCHSSGWC